MNVENDYSGVMNKIACFLDEQRITPVKFLRALPLFFGVALARVDEEFAEIVIDEVTIATKILYREKYSELQETVDVNEEVESNPFVDAFVTADKITSFLNEQQITSQQLVAVLPRLFAVSLLCVKKEYVEVFIDNVATATKLIQKKLCEKQKEAFPTTRSE